jgi:hypothetical protein
MMQTGNRSRRRGIVHGLSAGLLGLVIAGGMTASPARADWLVTREGGKVETRGPWQVKGKLVVFTRADDGSLASLRSTEVDLDASGKLTAEAKIQAAAPPVVEAPKKKLAVLTDQNFRKTAPPAPPTAADGKPADKKPAAATGPLAVGSWKRSESPEGDGLVIEGTLHNSTGDMLINASVEVQLYNEVGDRVGTAQGLLTSTSVQPNGSVDFRASFPGVFTFSDARFQPQGLPLNMSEAKPDDKGDSKPAEKSPPP